MSHVSHVNTPSLAFSEINTKSGVWLCFFFQVQGIWFLPTRALRRRYVASGVFWNKHKGWFFFPASGSGKTRPIQSASGVEPDSKQHPLQDDVTLRLPSYEINTKTGVWHFCLIVIVWCFTFFCSGIWFLPTRALRWRYTASRGASQPFWMPIMCPGMYHVTQIVLCIQKNTQQKKYVSWRIPAFLDADYVPWYVSRHTDCAVQSKTKKHFVTHPGFFGCQSCAPVCVTSHIVTHRNESSHESLTARILHSCAFWPFEMPIMCPGMHHVTHRLT